MAIRQISEFLQKLGLLIGIPAACGIVGFYIPLLFDRDVSGVAWAGIVGVLGMIVGVIIAVIIIRRNFD